MLLRKATVSTRFNYFKAAFGGTHGYHCALSCWVHCSENRVFVKSYHNNGYKRSLGNFRAEDKVDVF